MRHGEGAYAETPAGRVYYEIEGEGPAVIVVPGGPGVGHAHYHPWFSRLARRHSVVYFDHPGTGRSDRLPDASGYTIELYAETIEALRGELGLAEIALIGLSFGGMPALEYALRHGGRVRRLVLSNAQLSAATWQEGNIDNLNGELRNQFPGLWDEVLTLRQRGILSTDPAYQALLEPVVAQLEWVDPGGHPPLTRDPEERFEMDVYCAVIGDDPEWEVTGTLAAYDPVDSLEDLQTPALVVTGRYDRLTSPRIARLIEEALPAETSELLVFERSAHRPWVEEADLYFSAVEAFLQ